MEWEKMSVKKRNGRTRGADRAFSLSKSFYVGSLRSHLRVAAFRKPASRFDLLEANGQFS